MNDDKPVNEGTEAKSSETINSPTNFDLLVETWWNDQIQGSIIGRSTDIWNYLHGAKEELKERLRSTVP